MAVSTYFKVYAELPWEESPREIGTKYPTLKKAEATIKKYHNPVVTYRIAEIREEIVKVIEGDQPMNPLGSNV